MNCPYCKAEITNENQACPSCKFPINASNSEKHQFIYLKIVACKAEVNHSEDMLSKSKTIFFVSSGLLLLVAMVAFMGGFEAQYEGMSIILGITYLIFSAVFLILGLYILKKPTIISIVGLLLGVFCFSISLLGMIVMLALAYSVYCSVIYERSSKKIRELENELVKYNQ